ncbi:hypothetical protein RCL_jg20384.t1 [Rhizophagus clarus]|uniref:Uncharacterized protein n=1 Tax=Rhizophagus clarus TaxID=94130 RepID=A0A8H3KWB3_9GLOM|nr:hypothetical protein RCL_jg20384.t1 [Rhizophagus clarus]
MSSTRKLRSNSISSNATIKKQTNNKTPTIKAAELEFSITRRTYGLPEGPTSEEVVREILPQMHVKRQSRSAAMLANNNMKDVANFPSNKVPIAKQTQPEPEFLIIEKNK